MVEVIVVCGMLFNCYFLFLNLQWDLVEVDSQLIYVISFNLGM